jgi:hypothetical protein
MQVILNRMPHKRFGKETHQHFLNSVFRVAEAPQGALIRDGLLLGVIDRLLEVRLTHLRLPSACLPSVSNSQASARCRWTWRSSTRIWTTLMMTATPMSMRCVEGAR